MRRMNRKILGAVLIVSLLLAPVALAEESAGDGMSLVEWAQDVLNEVFGAGGPEGDGEDGLPNAGPHADPAG